MPPGQTGEHLIQQNPAHTGGTVLCIMQAFTISMQGRVMKGLHHCTYVRVVLVRQHVSGQLDSLQPDVHLHPSHQLT